MADSVVGEESKLKIERVVWVAVLFCTVSIPFLMTMIALVHIEDCPHQPYLPLVILMAGISMSLSNIINAADKYSPPKQTNYKTRRRIIRILNIITNCFTVTCFLCGAYWVYGTGKPSYTKSSRDYCNPTLHIFSFWLFNLSFVFIGLLVLIVLIAFSAKHIVKTFKQ